MAKTSQHTPTPTSKEDEPQWQDWAEVRDELLTDPATATAYTKAGKDLAAYEQLTTASLAQYRRARALTQIQLAQLMGISQAEVSRVEHQSDLRLSALASYIAAAGGRLVVGIEVQPGEPLIEMDIDALSAHESPKEQYLHVARSLLTISLIP